MTEDEAKTKLCPWARNSTMINYGMSMIPMANLPPEAIEKAAKKYVEEVSQDTDKCHASDCMMWQ